MFSIKQEHNLVLFKGLCDHSNSDLFTPENNMFLSRVKVSSLRVKAHLAFHWCLHNSQRELF